METREPSPQTQASGSFLKNMNHDENVIKKVLAFFELHKDKTSVLSKYSVQQIYDVIESKISENSEYDVNNVNSDMNSDIVDNAEFMNNVACTQT